MNKMKVIIASYFVGRFWIKSDLVDWLPNSCISDRAQIETESRPAAIQ